MGCGEFINTLGNLDVHRGSCLMLLEIIEQFTTDENVRDTVKTTVETLCNLIGHKTASQVDYYSVQNK